MIVEDFIKKDFLLYTNKEELVKEPRIICQQISNQKKQKRLQFYFCDKECVLANSCNYIKIQENEYDIDLYFLLAILNSKWLELYFRCFSSNNHINIYEIRNLPIPIFSSNKKEISNFYKEYIELTKIGKTNGKEYIILKEKISEELRKAFSLNEYR